MLSQSKANELNTLFGIEFNDYAERQSGKWTCPLSEEIIGDYFIIPLISAKMLKSEGYLMDNCCRDYLELCEVQKYRIFSMRNLSDERVATLGLRNDNGYWCFDQCFGPSNADVLEETIEYLDEDAELQTEVLPSDLYYVAHEVVRLMNAGHGSH
ncbi:PcfJ domain-containing protein [Desulfopila inferna]|uniref:PcfJ domain-containing protein n=1 Tax=Desulfopila inferna TaxID=468528 RepID=UPI001965C5CD|nr:PcfJ domain-containing protein [Desulfopila inferna]MBM9604178.1 PcfJ domain-containing protein [Desulfopila inferna]